MRVCYGFPRFVSSVFLVVFFLAASATLTAGASGTVSDPKFTPERTTFSNSLQVKLSSATSGAVIHYTINGKEPTESDTVYSGPITLTTTSTIKAKAFKSGMNPSPEQQQTYTQQIIAVAAPRLNPGDETFAAGSIQVTISCSTSGATIHYTTNGRKPTESDTVYSTPINISDTTTLKAVAFKSGMSPSPVVVGTYTKQVVNVGNIERCLTSGGKYAIFASPIALLKTSTLFLKANCSPTNASWPDGKPVWGGTFGITGNGPTANHAYNGTAASSSNSDFRSITVSCKNTVTRNVLVCDEVLGVHSNVGPGATAISGHAWISVRNYSVSPATITTYGLWPDDHPDYLPSGNNGPGWDIRVGRESSYTPSVYNRYYLLKPSQKQTLQHCLEANITWTYFNNCSAWASATESAVSGESVSAHDWGLLGVDTPRALGSSILGLEAKGLTSTDDPKGNGQP